ncbi:hypothetical protein [Verrucomicrobium spinosum]|uniref:hypothetical protein n=1 Tax=Verrucomicrobium spinosum TaxID=2736 RepID=UPI003CCD4774
MVVFGGPITGTAGFVKSGAGVLLLSGNNSGLSGDITVAAGTAGWLECSARCQWKSTGDQRGHLPVHCGPNYRKRPHDCRWGECWYQYHHYQHEHHPHLRWPA